MLISPNYPNPYNHDASCVWVLTVNNRETITLTIYLSAGDQCGGNYNSESGVLISPNYPNPYNHDASCVWVLTVNNRETITLTFTNMDLEGHVDCQFDYVEVM